MLLCKIDGEMNVQNGGFSAKLRNGDGGDMLHDWRQRQISWTRAIVFRRDDTLPTSKTLPATTRQPQWSIEIPQISRVPSVFTSVYVCANATVVPRLTAAAVAMHPHRRISNRLHVADVKNLIGDDQATLTVRNLGLFTFIRSQLTLRRRLRGFCRLLEIAQTARNRHQKHRRDHQDRSKFRKYENSCLRNQAKRLEKLLFPATNAAAIDGIVHCFFSCYHWEQLLFSH